MVTAKCFLTPISASKHKNRSEKDITVVRLLPVKKGETLSPSGAEDSSVVAASMVYLDRLKYHLHSYSLQRQIEEQQKSIDKIKAKITSLKNDREILPRRYGAVKVTWFKIKQIRPARHR